MLSSNELYEIDMQEKDGYFDLVYVLNMVVKVYGLEMQIDLGAKTITILKAVNDLDAKARLTEIFGLFSNNKITDEFKVKFIGNDVVFITDFGFVNNALRDEVKWELLNNGNLYSINGSIITVKSCLMC